MCLFVARIEASPCGCVTHGIGLQIAFLFHVQQLPSASTSAGLMLQVLERRTISEPSDVTIWDNAVADNFFGHSLSAIFAFSRTSAEGIAEERKSSSGFPRTNTLRIPRVYCKVQPALQLALEQSLPTGQRAVPLAPKPASCSVASCEQRAPPANFFGLFFLSPNERFSSGLFSHERTVLVELRTPRLG